MDSAECLGFLKTWGVERRLSSAYYAQSNGRAEAAVKTAKRILTSNTGPKGTLNTDAVAKALMQYRNTPIKGTSTSPAQLLLGQSIRDSIPQPPSAYKISNKWQQTLRQREKSMSQSAGACSQETSSRRTLDVLPVGTEVLIQNNETKQWDRRGMIIEVCPFRQYRIKVHGSGRSTTRNRIHLKPLYIHKPVVPNTRSPSSDVPKLTTSSSSSTTSSAGTSSTTESASFQTPDPSSSYNPSSSDYMGPASERSRSPLVLRKSNRETRVPDRYGEWTK